MGSVIIKALIKTLPFIIIGIILRLLYDKYYYRKKLRKEIEEAINTPGKIKIISFNNPNYIGFFYNWSELKRYMHNHDPENYINKVFSIEISHIIHYYIIISEYVIEEVTLSSDK